MSHNLNDTKILSDKLNEGTRKRKRDTKLYGKCQFHYEIHYDKKDNVSELTWENGTSQFSRAVEFPSSQREEVSHYSYNALRVTHPAFLRAYGAPKRDKTGGKLFIFYQYFEEYLDEWALDPSLSSMKQLSNLLKSMRTMLQGLKHLHKRDLCHGNLRDLRSYVVRNQKFYLINIRGLKRKKGDTSWEKSKCTDIEDFLFVMDGFLSQTPFFTLNLLSTPDRKAFMAYRNTDALHFARKLIGHTFLMPHPFDRMKKAHEMFEAIEQRTVSSSCDIQWIWDHEWDFKQLRNNWVVKAKANPVLQIPFGVANGSKPSKGSKVKRYNGTNLKDLLRFIRNTFEHHAKDGGFGEIAKALDSTYPGFIALTYQHLELKKKSHRV